MWSGGGGLDQYISTLQISGQHPSSTFCSDDAKFIKKREKGSVISMYPNHPTC